MNPTCHRHAIGFAALTLVLVGGCGAFVPRHDAAYLATLPAESVDDVRRVPVQETLEPGRERAFAINRPYPTLIEGSARSHALLLSLPPSSGAHELVVRSRFDLVQGPVRQWTVVYPRVRVLDSAFATVREIAPRRFVVRGPFLVASVYIASPGSQERYVLVTATTGNEAQGRVIRGANNAPAGAIRIAETGEVNVLLRSLAGDVVTTY